VKLKSKKSEVSPEPDPLSILGTMRLVPAAQKYGISRTELFRLCAEGQIKSHLVKRHPNSRGVRLVEEQSLIDYIRRGGAA
jgi:hypothetical protein